MDKKTERMIDLYVWLMSGKAINKRIEAVRHNVSDKSIQRDIEDLRDYVFKKHGASGVELVYDRNFGGYRLLTSEGKAVEFGELENLEDIRKK